MSSWRDRWKSGLPRVAVVAHDLAMVWVVWQALHRLRWGIEANAPVIPLWSAEIALVLAAQGLADVPIRYAAPVTVSAPIVHPAARTYLRVLSTADDAFASLERAWLLGLVDTRARRIEEARFRKALRGIGTRVREQYSAMARALREARAPAAPPEEPGGEPAPSNDVSWWQATAEAESASAP